MQLRILHDDLLGRPNGFLVVQFSDDGQSGLPAQSVMVYDEKLYLDDYTKTLEQENEDLREDLATANEKLFSLLEDGDQCLQELQKLRQFDEPLLVAYSSSIPEAFRRKLSEIGVDEFVEKTASIQLLSNRIQSLLTTS